MTTKGLHISADVTLPIDTITDTIGVLAIKGAGKTYAFLRLAELMVHARLPVVIIDVVGVCWGLRLSPDGKSDGMKEVVIFGGKHGDVEIREDAGDAIGRWVIRERRPCVIDVSTFDTKAATLRFARALFERIYQDANGNPIHIIIDEADEFAPQRPFAEQARVLRAVEVLVRRGRAKGLGVSLVTQRPAVINKNVITQISTLVVGRLIAPLDRKAVKEWVDANATEEQGRVFMDSLATLKTAEKWIWAPARDVFARTTVSARETYDSSATPKVNQIRPEPRKLTPIDLDAIREELAPAPPPTKRKVAPAAAKVVRPAKPAREPRKQPTGLIDPGSMKSLKSEVEKVRAALRAMGGLVDDLAGAVDLIAAASAAPQPPAPTTGESASVARHEPSPSLAKAPIVRGSLGKCPAKLLGILMQRTALGRGTRAEELAVLSRYSVTSSTFANALSELRVRDLVMGSRGHLEATPRAMATASGPFGPSPTPAESLARAETMLGRAERAILAFVWTSHPITREELALASTYSITSSTFANALSRLRTLGMIHGKHGAPITLGPGLERLSKGS